MASHPDAMMSLPIRRHQPADSILRRRQAITTGACSLVSGRGDQRSHAIWLGFNAIAHRYHDTTCVIASVWRRFHLRGPHRGRVTSVATPAGRGSHSTACDSIFAARIRAVASAIARARLHITNFTSRPRISCCILGNMPRRNQSAPTGEDSFGVRELLSFLTLTGQTLAKGAH